MRRPAAPDEHLAARFAAREALLKALGTGLVGRMSWRDIGVVPGEAGARPAWTSRRRRRRGRAPGRRPAGFTWRWTTTRGRGDGVILEA